jgi:hypothetical protein
MSARSVRPAPRAALAAVIFSASVPVVCFGDSTGPLEVINESQYALVEVRVHSTPAYAEATSVIDFPLAVGAAALTVHAGPVYVTVFREKYAGGPLLAFTTAKPVAVDEGYRYRVRVYDESFRIEAEKLPDEPGTADSSGCG